MQEIKKGERDAREADKAHVRDRVPPLIDIDGREDMPVSPPAICRHKNHGRHGNMAAEPTPSPERSPPNKWRSGFPPCLPPSLNRPPLENKKKKREKAPPRYHHKS